MNYLKIFFLCLFSTTLLANEKNLSLPSVDFSGFFRTRYWLIGVKNPVFGKVHSTKQYRDMHYQDLLLRHGTILGFNKNIRVTTLFDVFAKLNSTNATIVGANKTTLKILTAYGTWESDNGFSLEAGLLPISLSGGYLADELYTSGVRLGYKFNQGNVKLGAYQDLSDFANDPESPQYGEDNFFILSSNFAIMADWENEAYYVFKNDNYTGHTDDSKMKLHWLGWHSDFEKKYWFLKFASILNAGNLEKNNKKQNIMAALWNFDIGGKISDSYSIAYHNTGATGNPLESSKNNFQFLPNYNGFSSIGLDHKGGVKILGSSDWPGIIGHALRTKTSLLNKSLKLSLDFIHYHTIKKIEGIMGLSFGNEINFGAKWKIGKYGEFFTKHGVFNPADLALKVVATESKGIIYEGIFGFKISY